MLRFTYSIQKKAKDVGDYRITKHGQVAEFSLRELNRNIEQGKKQHKELSANAHLQETLTENIRTANPDLVAYLNTLSKEKRHALLMLALQENKAKQYRDQEKELGCLLKTLLKEDKEIRTQLAL